jgi:hypothetical protein
VRHEHPDSHSARRHAHLTLAGLALCALTVRLPLHADELKPFQASYNLIWKGMTVGSASVQLEKTSDDTWTYTSNGEGRGIGKLLSLQPKTVSVLRVTPTGVRPISYSVDDGSGNDKRTIKLRYDWDQHRVTGVYERTPVDLPLTPEVQDDASVQVALMASLLRGKTPDRFSVIDNNSVREYHYARAGEETLKTPFGAVATTIYTSQKTYSPRINRYWCATERGFVPIRVQQKKGDDVEWTMEIQSLTR